MITLEQAEAALVHLSETDEALARAKGELEYAKHYAKTENSIAFIEAEGKSVADRNARAQTDPAYEKAQQRLRDAVYDLSIISSRRKQSELTVELWKCINAARGRGQII